MIFEITKFIPSREAKVIVDTDDYDFRDEEIEAFNNDPNLLLDEFSVDDFDWRIEDEYMDLDVTYSVKIKNNMGTDA